MTKEIKYEIVKKLAILSEGKNGWTKEANLVKWNNGSTKLDIRDWNHEQNKMGKGITLNYEEKELLISAIEDLEF